VRGVTILLFGTILGGAILIAHPGGYGGRHVPQLIIGTELSILVDEYKHQLTAYNHQRHQTVLSDEELAKKTSGDIRLGLYDVEQTVKFKPRLSLKFSDVYNAQKRDQEQ
jgi:hypothetical protein